MPEKKQDDGHEGEGVLWADHDQADGDDPENPDHVDLNRFGQLADDGDTFENISPTLDNPSSDGDEMDYQDHQGEQQKPPFYKQKWVIFSAVGLIVFGAATFGFYKSKVRQARNNDFVKNQPKQETQSIGLPSIMPVEETVKEVPARFPPGSQRHETSGSPSGSPSLPHTAVHSEEPAQHSNSLETLSPAPGVQEETSGMQEKISSLEKQVKELRVIIENNEAAHQEKYKKIAAEMKSYYESKQTTTRKAEPVKKEESLANYSLQSIIPDRAWVVTPDKSIKVLQVGTVLDGGARVEKIMAREQLVVTSKGTIK